MDKKGGLRILKFSLQAQKKGDYKWSIMLSLILGLMVLSLSLYFIFNELWSGDDSDRQVCRQSIQVRALAPEFDSEWIPSATVSFKNEYPLKCKTHVVEVDKGDVKNIDKIIGETIAECWALFDKGDTLSFPSSWYGTTSACVPCARIHLTNEAKDEINKSGNNITIRNSLDERMDNGGTYYEYLKESGEYSSAFAPVKEGEFDFNGASFEVSEDEGETFWSWDGLLEVYKVYLPKKFDINKGDLLVNYGVFIIGGQYTPYLFYFQQGQTPSPFDEVKKQHYSWNKVMGADFCETWEGIPA